MPTLDELRATTEAERAKHAQLRAEMADLVARANARGDEDLSAGEQERWNNLSRAAEKVNERIEQLVADQRNALSDLATGGTVEESIGRKPVAFGRSIGGKPWEPRNWDDHAEISGRAVDALVMRGVSDDATLRRFANTVERNADDARLFLSASSPAYERAFMKLLADPVLGHNKWTTDERAAMERQQALEARAIVVGTNTSGGFAVPTHLDPTIILTNNGSANVMRQIARVVTLTAGNTWKGVSSAGVTASWDAELEEVSDDTPEYGSVSIPTHRATAFVPYSIEAEQDVANLASELARLFADAKDRLEGAAFETGSGTGEPTGIWTALDANTNVELATTTAATVGLVDLHAVYRALPGRFRRNASWLMNPLWAGAIRQLGTAVGSSFSGDLRDPLAERLIGRPAYDSDDSPATQTTTALDNILIFGDFSNYVIVDRMGMKVELIPHLFGTTNNRPIGARALYAFWRTGGDSVNDVAFRLLQDTTSA